MFYLYHVNALNYHELKTYFEIGRTQGDLVIGTDSLLSSRHVKFSRQETENQIHYFVEDLGSKNKSLLDRNELKPNSPVKVNLNSVLEIGNQKFIFTKNNHLQILEVNTILDENEKRVVIKLEGKKLIEDLKDKMKSEVTNLLILEEKYQNEIKALESKILEHQNKINQFLEMEKIELQKLDEQKKRITEQVQMKTNELKQQMISSTNEISTLQRNIAEIELKKAEKEQKIANFGKKHD